MRASWILAGAVVVLLLGWSMSAQAAPAGLTTLATGAVGAAATDAPTPQAPANKAPTSKATDTKATDTKNTKYGMPRPPQSNDPMPDRLSQAVMTASLEAWASKDEEVQKLLDKVLADRKASIQLELDRVAALDGLTQAARGGDEAAIKAAMQNVKTASDKVRQDGEAANKNFKALTDRLRSLRPAPTPPAAGETKGAPTTPPVQK